MFIDLLLISIGFAIFIVTLEVIYRFFTASRDAEINRDQQLKQRVQEFHEVKEKQASTSNGTRQSRILDLSKVRTLARGDALSKSFRFGSPGGPSITSRHWWVWVRFCVRQDSFIRSLMPRARF
jgi:hypothetical protein